MQTCAPRTHTKGCDYWGLPEDKHRCCKDRALRRASVSSAPEIQAFPCNLTPGDEPGTMKQGFKNVAPLTCSTNVLTIDKYC